MASVDTYSFGPFELLEHVGGGTFGIVYKARRIGGTTGLRALKVLRPIFAEWDPTYVDGLVREARIQEKARGNDHVASVENVQLIDSSILSEELISAVEWAVPKRTPGQPISPYLHGLKCGVLDGNLTSAHTVDLCAINNQQPRPSGPIYYIISEWYEDGDLSDALPRLREDPSFSIDDLLAIALDIADGLRHIHNNEIVHRDFKPANVLMQGRSPKISDFGISRQESGSGLSYGGTRGWSPPEQFGLEPSYNKKSDIYSFGQVLFWMLTDTYPYDTGAAGQPKLVASAKDYDDRISQAVSAVVDRCREDDPGARYQDCDELISALHTASQRQKQIPITGILHAPGDVRTHVTADGVIQVLWDRPELHSNSTLTGYKITATPSGRVLTTRPTTLDCLFENLDPKTHYTFTVSTVTADGDGPNSSPSEPVAPLFGSPIPEIERPIIYEPTQISEEPNYFDRLHNGFTAEETEYRRRVSELNSNIENFLESPSIHLHTFAERQNARSNMEEIKHLREVQLKEMQHARVLQADLEAISKLSAGEVSGDITDQKYKLLQDAEDELSKIHQRFRDIINQVQIEIDLPVYQVDRQQEVIGSNPIANDPVGVYETWIAPDFPFNTPAWIRWAIALFVASPTALFFMYCGIEVMYGLFLPIAYHSAWQGYLMILGGLTFLITVPILILPDSRIPMVQFFRRFGQHMGIKAVSAYKLAALFGALIWLAGIIGTVFLSS